MEQCPNLVACAPFFQEQHWDAIFELGIDQLMKGVRAG
jgi:hypothetical protein